MMLAPGTKLGPYEMVAPLGEPLQAQRRDIAPPPSGDGQYCSGRGARRSRSDRNLWRATG